jgi:DNA-binding transcriptional ArsR family regulator
MRAAVLALSSAIRASMSLNSPSTVSRRIASLTGARLIATLRPLKLM